MRNHPASLVTSGRSRAYYFAVCSALVAWIGVPTVAQQSASSAPSISSTADGGIEVTLNSKAASFSLLGEADMDIMTLGRDSAPTPNSEQAVVTRRVLLDVRDSLMRDVQEITDIVEAQSSTTAKVELLVSDVSELKSMHDQLKGLQDTVQNGELDRKDLRSVVEKLVDAVDAVVEAQSSGKDGCGQILETPAGAESVGSGSALHSVRVFRCKLGFGSGTETWVCDASGKWVGHELICQSTTSSTTTMTTTTPKKIAPLRIDFGHHRMSVQKGWVGAGFNDGSANRKGEWPRGNGGWQAVGGDGASVKMTGPLSSAGRSMAYGYTAATTGPFKDCELLGSTKFVGGLVSGGSGADGSSVYFKGLPPNAKVYVRSWHFGTWFKSSKDGKEVHKSRFRVKWGDQKWSSAMTSPDDPDAPNPPTTFATTATVSANGELKMEIEAVEPYISANNTPKINLNGIEIQSSPFGDSLVGSCQL